QPGGRARALRSGHPPPRERWTARGGLDARAHRHGAAHRGRLEPPRSRARRHRGASHRRCGRDERPPRDDRRIPDRSIGLTPSNGDRMAYESTAEPIKLGYLFDFRLPEFYPKEMREDLTRTFQLVFDEGLKQRIIDRPVQIVF